MVVLCGGVDAFWLTFLMSHTPARHPPVSRRCLASQLPRSGAGLHGQPDARRGRGRRCALQEPYGYSRSPRRGQHAASGSEAAGIGRRTRWGEWGCEGCSSGQVRRGGQRECRKMPGVFFFGEGGGQAPGCSQRRHERRCGRVANRVMWFLLLGESLYHLRSCQRFL